MLTALFQECEGVQSVRGAVSGAVWPGLYCTVLHCTVLYCTVQGLCDETLVPGRSWGDPRAKDGSHQATKRDCARLCASYSACRAWTFNTQVTPHYCGRIAANISLNRLT